MNLQDYLKKPFLDELAEKKWDIATINEWYSKQPWYVGTNYIPSTAINQLEMFQKETFDPERIDEELGWAENIGFNSQRIFLHNLLWETDPSGLKKRMNKVLEICEKHKMKVLFVLFDEMWDQDPKPGDQPDPIPGIHNSGWLAAPGKRRIKKAQEFPIFQEYVQGVISAFSQDDRILGWDIYNEPGNMGISKRSLPLVVASVSWAREIEPTQPITIGVWQWPHDAATWDKIFNICINCSDIISFHSYAEPETTLEYINELNQFDRPLFCTEYMARHFNNLFENHLPIFKKYKIGAFNWGLVSGKTQTIYNWKSQKDAPEPELWYHDIFYKDSTPYSQEEIDFIKKITEN
jgi:hypothetical protein